MRVLAVLAALLSLCGNAYAQQRPPDFLHEFQTAIDALHSATKAVQSTAPAAQNLGPCLSTLGSISRDNFNEKFKDCAEEDIKAVIDDATKNKDNVALDCFNPILPIAQALKDGKGGLLLAFQLFRDAKRQGVIGNCTSYINTTIMLQ